MNEKLDDSFGRTDKVDTVVPVLDIIRTNGKEAAKEGKHDNYNNKSKATINSLVPATEANNNNYYHLPQANLVKEDEHITTMPSANPVDLEAAKHRALQKKKKQQKTLLAAVLGLLLLVAGIIVGVVVGTKKNKEPKVVVLESTEASTEAPTVYNSMEPSEVPSSAPTGVLDMMLDSLPDYTIVSLNSGSDTPQWKAWWWLANHQNITFLPEWRKTQLFALATFFYSFEGEHWYHLIRDRWMHDTVEECDWFSSGFGYFLLDGTYFEFNENVGQVTPSCNSQGQFTSLNLESLDLLGHFPSIPPEIVLLTSLSLVDLPRNDIGGPISSLLPTELYDMTGLSQLDLRLNRFTGNIPSEIALLTSLSQLRLESNQFSGQIPSEISLLTSLSQLRLEFNQFSGQIPSEIALLTSLSWLDLRWNQFTGPVPSEFGLLTSLENLWLGKNLCSGMISSELGLLTSLHLLNLGDNQFTGSVPSEIGMLTALKLLWLDQNQLTDQVPSELGLLTAMMVLSFKENRLAGALPSELGHLTSLQDLWLGQNQLTSPVPSEFGAFTALTRLQLNDNQFTGTIPTAVGMLTSLTSLALQNNNLTGTLPIQLNPSMGLILYGNQFSGTAPGHLCSFLWCDCSQNDTPPVSTCADLNEAPPDWPGRFPTRGADVMLNIHTDILFSKETSWVWQKETDVTGIWDTLESGGPLEFKNYLYSSLFPVNTDTAYRLVVSDRRRNGFWRAEWMALTATNQTVLYSLAAGEDFSEITIDILVGEDGSFDITNSTTL